MTASVFKIERSDSSEIAVLNRAVEAIGDKNDAFRWMGTPVRALDFATPVWLLGTLEAGKPS